jgi:hypothetical protein
MLLATITNLVLIGFLCAWLLWWRRASRHIEQFKEARAEMAVLMGQLQQQIGVAQAEIANTARITRNAVPGIEQAIARAESLLEELDTVIASGERVADRIETAARAAHAVLRPLMEERAGRSMAGRPLPARPDLPQADPGRPAPSGGEGGLPRKTLFRGRPGAVPAGGAKDAAEPTLD